MLKNENIKQSTKINAQYCCSKSFHACFIQHVMNCIFGKAKLFWLRFLILFCIAACLVSESVAFGNIYKGGHGRKLTRLLRKVSIDL